MLKSRHHTILAVLSVIFITNQLLEKWGIYIYPFYCYLDDLLVVPITLGSYQWININVFKKKEPKIKLPVILICILGFSFHFELLMPILSTRYTRDFVDILMYASGGLFYIFIINLSDGRKTIHKINNLWRSKKYPA